jgi:hypothetical protein
LGCPPGKYNEEPNFIPHLIQTTASGLVEEPQELQNVFPFVGGKPQLIQANAPDSTSLPQLRQNCFIEDGDNVSGKKVCCICAEVFVPQLEQYFAVSVFCLPHCVQKYIIK